mgnify:CR=1 FL=1
MIIIGGGDTGADCLGTAHRQGARSVRQLELLQRPPDTRAPQNPWPTWPNIFRVSSAHEEGGERHYAIATERFSGTDERPRRAAPRHGRSTRRRPIEFEAGPRAAGDGVRRARSATGSSRIWASR